jgi:hypothetical protein
MPLDELLERHGARLRAPTEEQMQDREPLHHRLGVTEQRGKLATIPDYALASLTARG